jgi:hypothetical protein
MPRGDCVHVSRQEVSARVLYGGAWLIVDQNDTLAFDAMEGGAELESLIPAHRQTHVGSAVGGAEVDMNLTA